MNQTKKRVYSPAGSKAAETRQELFRLGAGHIAQAIKDGYFIEAIAIIESWIADRLEAHLSYVNREPCEFLTLERAIKRIEKLDTDEELKRLVVEDLNLWKNQRNKAVHELMKIQHGNYSTFRERIAASREPAQSGMELFRKIDRRINELRKEKAEK